MKTIGIIGGMSFESTATYYKIINEEVAKKLGGLNSAKIILYSLNFEEIASLQKQNAWDEAARLLGSCAKSLENAGADFILIATNTMHKIYEQVQAQIHVPLLHIATSTAKALKKENYDKIGLLGTKYTMAENFYKDTLKTYGIEALTPDESDMQEVSDIIFSELCKGQIKTKSKAKYLQIIEKLHAKGAKAIVLGCTEIGLLLHSSDTQIPLFDTAIIHALDAVELALEA